MSFAFVLPERSSLNFRGSDWPRHELSVRRLAEAQYSSEVFQAVANHQTSDDEKRLHFENRNSTFGNAMNRFGTKRPQFSCSFSSG